MAKGPLHPNSTGVFADADDRHKVAEALLRKGYEVAQVAKATGLPLSVVRRLKERVR